MAKQKPPEGQRRAAMFFEELQLSRLAILTRLTGASTAWMCRKAVDEYLSRRRSEWEPVEIRESKAKK
jgi:hypothetical protein